MELQFPITLEIRGYQIKFLVDNGSIMSFVETTCPVLNVVKKYQESEFRGGGLIIARHVKSEFVKNYLVTNNVVQRMTLIQFVLIS